MWNVLTFFEFLSINKTMIDFSKWHFSFILDCLLKIYRLKIFTGSEQIEKKYTNQCFHSMVINMFYLVKFFSPIYMFLRLFYFVNYLTSYTCFYSYFYAVFAELFYLICLSLWLISLSDLLVLQKKKSYNNNKEY